LAVQHIKDQITDHALKLPPRPPAARTWPRGKTVSIENAIDEIGGELHSQYSLTYTPSDTEAPAITRSKSMWIAQA